MKAGIKVFIALAIALIASLCVSASDTTTKFQTGPFNVSIDLGELCSDPDIKEPVLKEELGGDSYTEYSIKACGFLIRFMRYDSPVLNLNDDFGPAIQSNLLSLGAEKDTIQTYYRKIDGKNGVVASGYMPQYGATFYLAGYYVSPKSACSISGGNESKMISVLKTIHITEAP